MPEFKIKLLSAVSLSMVLSAQSVFAQSGQIDLLTWLGGADAQVVDDLIAGFEARYPDLSVNLVPVTTQGDQRGGIRTALMGGVEADVIVNTWPAFRKELADAGLLRDVSGAWDEKRWGDVIADSWRELSSTDGAVYGVPYTFGYRSGIWHVPADLETIGLNGFPDDWESLKATFAELRNAGFAEPLVMPARVYAHAEWFESLLVRTGGTELARQLVEREIAWTDDQIVEVMRRYAELFAADCCADPQLMNASHWDDGADRVFVERTANYLLIGAWINARAEGQYGLEPAVDYMVGKFPALGEGYDTTSMVDAKEFLATSMGSNPEGADLFLDYVVSAEGADIIAARGFTTPSSAVDISLYNPVAAASIEYVSAGPVQFVLGDLLPGELVDEYRLALQQFIANPIEEQIMPTLERIEAVAQRAY